MLLPSGAGDPPPAPKTDETPAAKAAVQVTREGLPEGAVARIGSPRLRHAGEVTAVAFSRDGRWLATVSPESRDKSVRVWNLTDGQERYRIPIAANAYESVRVRPTAVAFTEGDKRLLVLDADGFRSFDAATGRQERAKVLFIDPDPNKFFPREGLIAAAFSPDAKAYAVVRRNGELVLGDTATGGVRGATAKVRTVPEGPFHWYAEILFTPDGSEVCVPNSGSAAPVFDAATGEPKRPLAKELVPQNGSTDHAAFAAGGRTFVAVANKWQEGQPPTSAVSVADVATGKVLRTIPVPAHAGVLSVSPNGKLLAVSTGAVLSTEVRVLDLESGKEVQSVPFDRSPARITFSPDSRLLAVTCANDGRATVWDLGKNARHPQSADGHVLYARFDPRGHVELKRLNGTTTVDWRSGKVLEDKEAGPGPYFRNVTSEDGKVRAEVEFPKGPPRGAGTILVKEVASGKVVVRMEGLSNFPRRMVFADRNRLFVTLAQDEVLTVWDVATGKPLWSEAYPANSFGYMGLGDPLFDAANRRMAICSRTEKGTVIDVWELGRRNRVARVEASRGPLVGGIAFSSDGAFVAGGDEAVTCWRVSDGRAVHTLGGHAANTSSHSPSIRCEFSTDGRKLLTVDEAGTIRVWEFATGQLIRTFSGHSGQTTAAFSPDARAIVGASFDAPILVWDVYGLGKPTPFNADRVWNDLADASPATAFRAVRELCAAPKDAVALLKDKLGPESIDPKAIDGWVKDLSAEQFADRERATTALERQGEAIAPRLRAALGAATDAEARQRLAALLKRVDRIPPDGLRVRRAVDALEHLGTPEAKAHLEALSRGTPGCVRTVQAQEALSRISGQQDVPPQ